MNALTRLIFVSLGLACASPSVFAQQRVTLDKKVLSLAAARIVVALAAP